MGKEKTNLLVIGDGVTPTGFSRVLHSTLDNFDLEKFNISWLAVNFYGDPHSYPYAIYPARNISNGDVYGISKVEDVCNIEQPDIIFILNDIWVIKEYLNAIKNAYVDKQLPKIFIYFPVDATDHDRRWYSELDIVTKVYTYTEFAREVANKAHPGLDIDILPHGTEHTTFYKLPESKIEVRKQLFPKAPHLHTEDVFIILNANRNQPRKRVDITMRAFADFAKDKGKDVYLYLHMGLVDQHINVVHMAEMLGIDNRLIISNNSGGTQRVTDTKLNLIYNATDIGVNTSLGEGWGLVNVEHALTGAPQIVGNFSATKELFNDCGIVVDSLTPYTQSNICTTGQFMDYLDVSKAFNTLYNNRELLKDLSEKALIKFTQEKYSWKTIANKLSTDMLRSLK